MERAVNKSRTGNSSSNNNNYATSDMEPRWTSWLVPVIVLANVAVFIVVLYINDCPKHRNPLPSDDGKCVARFLRRFSFQPLRENPLFGPSSNT